MFKTLEFRRQLLHISFGVFLIYLLKSGLLSTSRLFVILIIGAFLIYLYQKKVHVPWLYRILHFFEREHHLREFPGRGIFFYVLGAFLATLFFPLEFALAGIAILAFGDAVTNLIGSNFGQIRILFKPKKSIEGLVSGIIAGFLGACLLTQLPPLALIIASSVAMIAEIPHLKIYNFPLDDNLVIPLSASFTLYLLSFL